jgi:hypothetical protein
MDKEIYEIVEGMRRAKAALRCGRETITAQIDGYGEVIQVPLSSLLLSSSWVISVRPSQMWRLQKMNSNFSDSAIRAIHRVIILTRHLGYKNTDPQVLARILDHADALGFMLMNDFQAEDGEETSSLFRRHLQGIEEKFDGFQGLTQTFDENMQRSQAISEQKRERITAIAA